MLRRILASCSNNSTSRQHICCKRSFAHTNRRCYQPVHFATKSQFLGECSTWKKERRGGGLHNCLGASLKTQGKALIPQIALHRLVIKWICPYKFRYVQRVAHFNQCTYTTLQEPAAFASVQFFQLSIGFHSLVIARNNDSAEANDPREDETSWDAEWRRSTRRHPRASAHHALFRRYCNFYKLPRCCAVSQRSVKKGLKKNILPSKFWFFCKHCPRPLVPDIGGLFFIFSSQSQVLFFCISFASHRFSNRGSLNSFLIR
jgi:hypothetical protein